MSMGPNKAFHSDAGVGPLNDPMSELRGISDIWRPTIVENPSDVADRIRAYTNGQKRFVVFANGTVFFTGSLPENAVPTLGQLLKETIKGPTEFRVTEMKDGDYLIRFTGPLYGVVFGGFFRFHLNNIRRGIETAGFFTSEVIIKPEEPTPEDHALIGLYARAKLYADVACPKVAIANV